jgi:hypothetical protein
MLGLEANSTHSITHQLVGSEGLTLEAVEVHTQQDTVEKPTRSHRHTLTGHHIIGTTTTSN